MRIGKALVEWGIDFGGLGDKALKKIEAMRPGVTARPEVSFEVEEAYVVFSRASRQRNKKHIEGFKPPWIYEPIKDGDLTDCIEIVEPCTDKQHLIIIIDYMDMAFLSHSANQPKAIQKKKA